ncbi:MAG TPA: thiamine phosphate synthase [Lichenihabitans sp.]|jgi:thiamine-phosphate pyrophosphorylase|nr:thiamine phosphate synthase [Lichenihabitans sp.]
MTLGTSIYPLCLVTDRGLARGRSLADVVAAAVRGGVTMVQLREKRATTRAFLEEARALKALLQGRGVPLIVNDRVDIALAVDADGVHVGQSDMPVETVRALIGPDKLVGLSITDEEAIARPDALAADYLGIGPVHPQHTKSDASVPLGIGGFGKLRRLTAKPVLAIGGVKPADVALLHEEGADGFAVVSAIMAAEDPEAAARAFRDASAL